MDLEHRLLTDLKSAIQSGDQTLKSVTKMLLSEIRYAQSAMNEKNAPSFNNEELAKIIDRYYLKVLKNYQSAVDKEKKSDLNRQLEIVKSYLPMENFNNLDRHNVMSSALI